MEESGKQEDIRHMMTVPLVQQCYSWDCGLACVSMVLSYFNIPTSEVYTKDLDFLQCGESVWTIDLAYLLARYKIPHQLSTITLGANSDYASKIFYRGSFAKDEERINHMFADAATEGVCVEKRSVTLDEITHQLSQGSLILVLIDWSYLECIWCHSQIRRSCFCCLDMYPAAYQGHYIVLCGFDRRKGFLFYKNPNANGEGHWRFGRSDPLTGCTLVKDISLNETCQLFSAVKLLFSNAAGFGQTDTYHGGNEDSQPCEYSTFKIIALLTSAIMYLCCSRFEPFEKARKSHGTDEDIIFVFDRSQKLSLSAADNCF